MFINAFTNTYKKTDKYSFLGTSRMELTRKLTPMRILLKLEYYCCKLWIRNWRFRWLLSGLFLPKFILFFQLNQIFMVSFCRDTLCMFLYNFSKDFSEFWGWSSKVKYRMVTNVLFESHFPSLQYSYPNSIGENTTDFIHGFDSFCYIPY